MPTLGELVSDIVIAEAAVKVATENREISNNRLLDGLALLGIPLQPRSRVVIGNMLVARPYEHLKLELSHVLALPDSVDPSVNSVPDSEPVQPPDPEEMF